MCFVGEEFERLFGTEQQMLDFWRHELGEPWTRNHEVLTARQFTTPDTTLAVPLGLHGDDAQFTKRGKLLVLSLNGPLCRQENSRLVITVIDWQRCPAPSLDAVYGIIKWSFECLATGRWPLADHLGNSFPRRSVRARLAGQPLLAPGWVGLFTEMRGDWKFLKETFHLNPLRKCRLYVPPVRRQERRQQLRGDGTNGEVERHGGLERDISGELPAGPDPNFVRASGVLVAAHLH
jgi:hypothetical protein